MFDNGTHQVTVAVARAEGEPFTIEPATIRGPRKDEVLVKVVAAGLCHTDLIVRDQYYPVPLPAVLGHEGSGIVGAVGPEQINQADADSSGGGTLKAILRMPH